MLIFSLLIPTFRKVNFRLGGFSVPPSQFLLDPPELSRAPAEISGGGENVLVIFLG